MEKINIDEYRTQKDIILAHLQKYGNISTKEGYDKYMVMRVGSVINILRKEGYNIITDMEQNKGTKKRYARYYLKEKEN